MYIVGKEWSNKKSDWKCLGRRSNHFSIVDSMSFLAQDGLFAVHDIDARVGGLLHTLSAEGIDAGVGDSGGD